MVRHAIYHDQFLFLVLDDAGDVFVQVFFEFGLD
jgi:hypothetical protein